MSETDQDFTGRLGQLFQKDCFGRECEWAMYSYNTVSMHFWNAFANELLRRGMSEEKVKWTLQSKLMRYMLDQKGDRIEELGRMMAAEQYPAENEIQPVTVTPTSH